MTTALAGTVLTAAVYLARRYLIGGVCTSKAMLDGKTAIITGANSGIGKETAIDLAKRNARVIVACRSKERGQKAVADIRERSGNTNVYFRPLDLASFSSVHQFASGVLSEEPKIDILINNAAVFLVPYSKTVDGVETHFSVNYLGHFLLTNLLLDRLREAPSARIINVAADIPPLVGTLTGGIDFNDINSERSYNRIKAYTQSKYAVLLYSAHLAQQLKDSRVTVSTVHPGVVRNEFGRNTSYFVGYVQILFYPLMLLLLKSPWQGAQTSIYCAAAEELEGVTGQHYVDCRAREPMIPRSLDASATRRLIQISNEITALRTQ
ncbi:hypothetical protein EMCRGX_G001273 [Ephydatia muelleri]